MSQTRRSARQMYPLIEAYLAAEESQPTFCTRHGLPRSVFQYWLAKYRHDRSEQASFVALTPALAPAFAEIRFASGAQVRLLSPVSATYLLELVQ